MTDRRLQDLLSTIAYSSYLSERREAFLKIIGDSDTKEMATFLVSLAVESPVKLTTVPQRSRGSYVSLEKAFGLIIAPLLEDNKKEAAKAFRSLPLLTQLIIYVTLSGKLSSLGKDFLFSCVDRIYSFSQLLAEFIVLPEKTSATMPADSVEYLRAGLSVITTSEAQYPFYMFKVPKKRFKLGYFIKEGSREVSNIPSISIRKVLASKGADGGYLVAYKKQKGVVKYNVMPLIKTDARTLKELLKGAGGLEEVQAGFHLKKTSRVIPHYTQKALITNGEELKSFLAKGERFVIVSSEGVMSVRLRVRDNIYKIVDYLLDENYEAIGFKYKDSEGNIKEIKCEVDDKALSEGIEEAYIKLRGFLFNDEIVRERAVSVLFGMYKRCPVCSRITSKHVKGVCNKDYQWLLKVAKSHIEDEFTLDAVCEEGGEIQVEKYLVSFHADYIKFKKNLEGVKGQQLLLPFNYEDF